MKPTWVILFFIPIIQHSQAWRHWKRPVCDPVKCEPNCREVSNPKGCPTCLCEKVPECAVPKCEPGCKVQTEFIGPCPGCDCEEEIKVIAEEPLCAPVKCTAPCREINDLDGCPSCLCDPLCSPPKCDSGCEIETVFEGPCPGCKCEDDIGISDGVKLELKKPMCDPPLCPPGCVIETVFEGPCPGCKCEEKGGGELKPGDIACSPPKCAPGCEIEIEFEGPCPGCKCGIRDEGFVDLDLTKALCDPVKCGPNCREEVGQSGCPVCNCQKDIIPDVPLCSPPKCDPGCEVEKEFDGPCPGCKCELKEKIDLETEDVCPPLLDCGRSCKVEKDEKGCEKCVCEPECGIPLCQEGCFLKKRPSQPCPSCHCPKRWSKHG